MGLKRDSERTCIVTRTACPAAELIRFALSPSGEVTFDLKGKLPGRGVWVGNRASLVREALKRKAFLRAFKCQAMVPETLVSDIDAALLKDLRQALSLANKAGNVISGFAKVESAVATKDIAALLHAREAAEDGRRKLAGALLKRFGTEKMSIPVIGVLATDELDLALGRSHVIHAALIAGAGSDGFLRCWRRLRDYRDDDGGEEAGILPEGGSGNACELAINPQDLEADG